ncbi:ADP-ribosylglycohydrolase family protein [Actinocrispum sp. NPDC049592]|uniref:ADP-ribosylglycohydrolase family protein n=1 Tax=Actinocrispum sp. NPDC049592 TaxID=3154835 RepID=UPI003447A9E3
MPIKERDRIWGWLYGGAVGGALGAAVRFDEPDAIVRKYGESGPAEFTGVLGRPGALITPVQQTLMGVDAMIRAHLRTTWFRYRTDPWYEVIHALRRWLLAEQNGWLPTHTELYVRRWADRTTLEALRARVLDDLEGISDEPVNSSQGNAALNVAGVAALWSDDPEFVFGLGARIAMLTHGHPNAYLSAGAYAVMVNYLMSSNHRLRAVDAARAVLVKWDHHEEVLAALTKAVDGVLTDQRPLTPEVLAELGDSNTAMGALAIAIRASESDHRFHPTVAKAITISGDSATTGFLTGSLVGLSCEYATISADLVGQLELSKEIGTLANCAFDEFAGEPDRSESFLESFPFSS